MKRMLCFISAQPLPNFIPVNEPETRPDALHCVYTPNDKQMERRFNDLRVVLQKLYPAVQVIGVKVAGAYDAQAIQRKCFELLKEFPGDEWSLNCTGGTKLMSAPAMEVFKLKGLQDVMNLSIYYIETSRKVILKVASDDWQLSEIKFTGTIEVEKYFALYGREVVVGKPQTVQEAQLLWHLQQLNWHVWPSVHLKAQRRNDADDRDLAEYDAIGIDGYQLYAFECKKLSDAGPDEDQQKKINNLFSSDTYKLFQVRQGFGGPFGKSYWVFEGTAKLRQASLERLELFSVRLISRKQLSEISKTPISFGLPPRKPDALTKLPNPNQLKQQWGIQQGVNSSGDVSRTNRESSPTTKIQPSAVAKFNPLMSSIQKVSKKNQS